MKRKMITEAGAPAIDSQLPWQRPDILLWLERLGRRPQLCGDQWGQSH
jgi:hypothetical protein